ncbi:MAG: glutamine-hydrolyzing GMP synthase, partial [Planctomycetota bacterium]|nr:glutamine-hydrolyzing GMP synthase [Planctomycetota bacterium]
MTASSQAASTSSSASQGGMDLSGEDQILVLDFGGQTAQLIARRVREENVFCQLVRHNLTADRIREINPKGIILSGSPASVYGENAPQPDPEIFELGIPVLGICYGMQLACRSQGSHVTAGKSREFGLAMCNAKGDNALFNGIPGETRVWMSHGDQVENLSESFHSIATTETCPHAAVQHKSKEIYGLQFHPEVTHTELGGRLLRNFVRDICGCAGTWRIESLIERETAAIRERVGNSRVICGLSGGVDSSVVAALLYKAIGDQLSCIFVDNGLLRKGEAEQVREHFGDHFKTDLHVSDARKLFLDELAGVTDPQAKRKIIGRLF